MISSSILGVLLTTILLFFSVPEAASYTKYGRTCKDIGCRRDEVCVMAEDPCSIYQRNNCGRYPTCTKTNPGEASCASTVCNENEYCKTENGVPTCVKKSNAIDNELFAEFDGDNKILVRRQSTGQMESVMADDVSVKGKDTRSGYPSGSGYPSSDSSKGYPTNSGYPASTGSGYPGYPSSSSSGYPGYPSSSSSGYPSESGYPSRSSGYPSESGYPSRSSGYPSQSGYPSRGGSGYPTSSNGYPGGSYPSTNSGGYPSSSGSSSANEESVKRVGSRTLNAAYPGYPNQGQTATQNNYPSQNAGYPGSPGYQQGYPAQGNYPAGYQPGYQPPPGGYPGGYQQGYYPPPTTRKPNIGDQLSSLAKDLAGKLLTQAIIDKVSGKH